MWALRRVSNPLKCQAFSTIPFRACCAKSEIAACYFEDKAGSIDPPPATSDRSVFLRRFYSSTCDAQKSFTGKHSFSSQAGMKSSGEDDDDLEDGFSELETPVSVDVTQGSDVESENDDELITEPELSEDDNEEIEVGKKISQQKRVSSALFKAIMDAPGMSVHSALEKWVEEGNDVTRAEVARAMLDLRKRRMYGRALQLSEWLESSKKIEFIERDYSSRVDLIAKIRGLQKAEYYINNIPESFRGELVYRTLLANCVRSTNVKRAEDVFNKMKDLEFSITPFACNQLLLLYKRTDKKKIADVLLLMEKENVKPTLFTYKLLIDTKGQSNDIAGMEQIVETMKAEGIEPDIYTQAILARHYSYGGLKEKAEAILKEMEGSDLKETRSASSYLLPLYAALGNAGEVGRVWKACESNPRVDECIAAIRAWGKLKKVEEAEAVFGRMSDTLNRLSSKHYSALLEVYANNKMLSKGKDLVNQMAESGCRIGPFTWDALVNLYVQAGEVEKADTILQNVQQNQMKPMFSSYMTIMEQYSKRGDIHKTEKIFHRMRQIGYMARLRQFQSLLQAYIIAKAPAYGMKERMKADNIFPNKPLAAQLAQVDPFKKTAISDLLE